jgi:hypothetical protein
MATTPRKPLKIKTECDANVKDWRSAPTSSSQPKSRGISPTKFHQKRHRTPKDVEKLHLSIEESLDFQQKREHATKLAMQRAAFKKLTDLKSWPLQDMAMEHYEQLKNGATKSTALNGADSPLSESSSSGSSSFEEPKRCMRQLESSPRKSALRQHYLDEFELVETTAQNNNDNPEQPLWSRQPRIFATEKAQGKRKYLVGHFGRIQDLYWRKMNPKHLYEVIQEQTPCRLYFDLEYSKVYNVNIDAEKLLEEFREELAMEIQQQLKVPLKPDAIVDLESSNDSKFSRHWIVHLDGLFADAPAVGRFVKQLVGRLAEEMAIGQLQNVRPTLAQHLFVQTKDAAKTSCFIDLGVYTRNRLFRCWRSSKFGKTSCLEIASNNTFPFHVPPEGPPTPKATLQDFINANDWTRHAQFLAQTLVVPLENTDDVPIFDIPEDTTTAGPYPRSGSTHRVMVHHPSISIRTAATPLPTLDQYVVDVLATKGGISGAIRAWSMEYGRGDAPISITYQLVRNRYCQQIGRSHKSNNIYWIVEFATWTCVQGCHDPECFGRSSPMVIAKEHLAPIQNEYRHWQEEEFEKALLALNLEDDNKAGSQRNTEAWNGNESKSAETTENQTIGETRKAKTFTDTSEKDTGPTVTADEDEPEEVNTSIISLSDDALLDAVLSNPNLFP